MPMLILMGGLSGVILAPSPAIATLPVSIQILGGFLASTPLSVFMGRFGRMRGFIIGNGFATLGSFVGVWAPFTGTFSLLILAHFFLGIALASYQFFRFAAADVVHERYQPVAISLILTSGLVAAFLGPQAFLHTKDTLYSVPMAGAYAAIGGLSLLGLLPLAIARFSIADPGRCKPNSFRLIAFSALHRKPVRNAIVIGAVSHGLMIYMMVSSPMAMSDIGIDAETIASVISWHTAAMFFPSLFTGILIQKFEAFRVTAFGFVLMIVAAMTGVVGWSSNHFHGSLVALGIGWNFCFIGSTSILANSVIGREKPIIQGLNDTVIGIFAMIFSLAAGAFRF